MYLQPSFSFSFSYYFSYGVETTWCPASLSKWKKFLIILFSLYPKFVSLSDTGPILRNYVQTPFFLACFLFSRHGVWGPEVAISHRILRYSPPPTFKGSDRRSQINTKQLTGRRRRYTILQRLGRRDQRGLYYRRHTVLAGSVHRGEIAILPAPGARKSSVLILMVMGHY